MNQILESLIKATKKINAEFKASQSVWHNASAGTIREKIIKDVIRPYLPKIYGIRGGLCYDKDGHKSRQLDSVIYNDLYSIHVPFSDDFSIFPCESIYGNIEVKSSLNKKSLKEAIENIKSLKSLEREDATHLNLTPYRKISLANENRFEKTNNYFGAVFAYEGPTITTFFKYLEEYLSTENNYYLPDMFVLLNRGIFVVRANLLPNASWDIRTYGPSHAYIYVDSKNKTLAYFVYTLLSALYSSDLAISPINDLLKLSNENQWKYKFFSSQNTKETSK